MTVANTNVSSTYNCNGVTREWNIGFHYNSTLSGLSIVVKHADGTSTTVSANYEIESGVLTYPTVDSELDPLPEGDVITITRITPLTQNINLVQQGPLDAEALESGYDKATIQIQEVASKKQDKLKAGDNIIIDEDGTISASGTISEGVYWGNVHGTLSNQTDLGAALNAKQATISDLETIRSGASAGATALQSTDITSTYSATGTDAVNGTAVASAISDKANTNLSNLTSTGEAHFDSSYVKLQSGVTQANVDYIVSSTHTSTSWCRVWKSGWCEQGAFSSNIPFSGGLDITFVQQMKDSNYAVFGGAVGTGSAADDSRFAAYNRTKTGMTIDWTNSSHDDKTWWEVKGFIAEEE